MNIFTKIRAMVTDDSGAVTVDWVVLTAAVVILSIGAISSLDTGIAALITDINSELDYNNIATQAGG